METVSPRQKVPEIIQPKPVHGSPIKQPSQGMMMASQLQEALVPTPGGAPAQQEPTAEEATGPEFETHWRCWKCHRIYQMNEACARCRVELGDYPGSFDDILEEVKIEPTDQQATREFTRKQTRLQGETPGAPESSRSSAAVQPR